MLYIYGSLHIEIVASRERWSYVEFNSILRLLTLQREGSHLSTNT